MREDQSCCTIAKTREEGSRALPLPPCLHSTLTLTPWKVSCQAELTSTAICLWGNTDKIIFCVPPSVLLSLCISLPFHTNYHPLSFLQQCSLIDFPSCPLLNSLSPKKGIFHVIYYYFLLPEFVINRASSQDSIKTIMKSLPKKFAFEIL